MVALLFSLLESEFEARDCRLIVAKKKKEKIVAEETRRFRIDSLLLLIGGSGLTRSIPGGEVRFERVSIVF